MSKLADYPIAVIDDAFDAQTSGAMVIRDLVAALEARGHRVLPGLGMEAARADRVIYTGLSGLLVSIDGIAEREALIASLMQIVALALARAPDMPVFLDALDGRGLARMVVPYPPGIPLIMPGERVSSPLIVDYLRFCEDWDRRFPGFETDIHGIRKEADGRYHLDCVAG
ncbi:MAG TPA: hypothetical protein VFN77_08075 [Acetobacteraceae bacterium]|nr:hypothetical protein [Acetobacteraceae bacterium]